MTTGYTLTLTDGVATLTVDRPAQRNALDVPLLTRLVEVVAGLGRVSQRSGSMGGIVDSCLVLLCSMTLRGPGSSR